jgi:hypothetical protein
MKTSKMKTSKVKTTVIMKAIIRKDPLVRPSARLLAGPLAGPLVYLY